MRHIVLRPCGSNLPRRLYELALGPMSILIRKAGERGASVRARVIAQAERDRDALNAVRGGMVNRSGADPATMNAIEDD